MNAVELRVLGSLELIVGGAAVPVGTPKERALLAVLACHANRMVPNGTLVVALWGDDPPRTADKNLQIYVHRLRRTLADPGRIARRPPGYSLLLGDDELDASRFRKLVDHARRILAGGRAAEARALLDQALGLWHGPAFADTQAVPAARDEAAALEEGRLAALELRVQVDLGLGRNAEAIGELLALVAAHPLRERFRAQLMVALYRTGRQAEALAAYRDARRVLVEELGLEPGDELRRLERAVLAGDPVLDPPTRAAPTTGPAPPPVVPCQLPADLAEFTGRADCLKQLDALLPCLDADGQVAVVIGAIAGPAGVGKTALAVHWAHRVRDRFPDGQLFVNLQGYAPSPPLDPLQALSPLLRALGVAADQIPVDLEDAAGMYRSLLADRRVLLVLDNASGAEQVRPLLPGHSGCLVVVTSRDRMGELTTSGRIVLDPLPLAEAVELLGRVVGDDRVAQDPAAAQEIASCCGQLPLALRIAGARLADRPHRDLAWLAARLGDERRRLDELAAGDLEVRASLTLSMRALPPPARRLFRLLGLVRAAEIAAWVAAALLDSDVDAAEELLDHLAQAWLVEVAGTDHTGAARYRLHELVRAYATERLAQEETPADRDRALHRALGAWFALAEAAERHFGSGQVTERGTTPTWRPTAELTARLLADPAAWYATERLGLVAAVEQAAEHGLAELAWNLSDTLTDFFEARGDYDDWERTHVAARAACHRAGNRRGQGHMLNGLANLRLWRARDDDAESLFGEAEQAFAGTGDRYGLATAVYGLADIHRRAGRLRDAVHRFEQARANFNAVGDRRAEAYALQGLADALRQRHHFKQAAVFLEQARAVVRRSGHRRGQAQISYAFGLLHLEQGHLDEAADSLTAALDGFDAIGDSTLGAYARCGLGDALARQGRLECAAGHLDHARTACQAANDAFGHAWALTGLGQLHTSAGRLAEAGADLERALAIWRAIRRPVWEARTLERLGLVHAATGDHAAAERAWRQALTVFARIDAPPATWLAARLDGAANHAARQ